MQTLKMDFQSQSTPPVVPVMQSDAQSRFIGITLYNGGVPYEAPEGASYTVQYRGPGANNIGWYDTITLSSGTRKAVIVDSARKNVVTLELAEQALRVNGNVFVNLCVITNTGYMLKTFPILCRVTGAAFPDTVAVQSFFYVTGLTSAQWLAYVTACQDAQKRAEDAAATFETDPTLSVSGKAADAAKVGQVKEDLDIGIKDIHQNSGIIYENIYYTIDFKENGIYQETDTIPTNKGTVKITIDNSTESQVNIEVYNISGDEKELVYTFTAPKNQTSIFETTTPRDAISLRVWKNNKTSFDSKKWSNKNVIVASVQLLNKFLNDGEKEYPTFSDRMMADEKKLKELVATVNNTSIINVLDVGCKGDGKFNNTPILNALLDTPDRITLYFPAGEYKINNTVVMYNSNLILDNNARLYTENALPYLISVNPLDSNTKKYKYSVSIKNYIHGGIFDGGDVAYNIIGLEHYTNFDISDAQILNFIYRGIECATDRAKKSTVTSHGGLMVHECLIRNFNDTGNLSNTIGIDNRNASDNKFYDCTIVNCKIGIYTAFAMIARIHHWISFLNILEESVFCVNTNSFTAIDECIIDTVLCAVQSIGIQTRITNSSVIFNPLFVSEETRACFAKHGVSSGYVYAINCTMYMPTGKAKVSEYETSNFPDKYAMCRFVPEENFDFSNYNPLF